MNNTELIYELSIVEDATMPFTFDRQKIGIGKYADGDCLPCAPNWHENIEILYFIFGEGKVSVDVNEYTVLPGDVIVANSNLIHRVTTDTAVEYYYLIPDKNFLKNNMLPLHNIIFDEKIKDEDFNRHFNHLISTKKEKNRFHAGRMRATVLYLVSYLCAYHSRERTGTAEKNEFIKKAIEYIEENLVKPITIDELADFCKISKHHFMRSFKKHTKYTVIEYVNLRRCNMAQTLLQDKSKKITEIGMMCGFNTISYFSRTFIKYIGISPKEYREKFM